MKSRAISTDKLLNKYNLSDKSLWEHNDVGVVSVNFLQKMLHFHTVLTYRKIQKIAREIVDYFAYTIWIHCE